MKANTILFTAFMLFCILSCNQQEKETNVLSFGPKVVEANGYVVLKDSMAEPKIIPVGKPKVVPVGNPKVVTIPTNVHPVGNPKVIVAGTPKVCTPGQDSFTLPKTVRAIERPFVAGIPEKVLAKEATSKDPNPYSRHNIKGFQ